MLPRTAHAASSGRLALTVLFLVSAFAYVDRFLITVLQVPIKAELGLSDAQLGAVTGLAFAAVYATAAVPLARVVDRGRRTLIMAIALTFWSALTALTSLVTGFGGLVACRFGLAVGEAVGTPATQSLLADYFPLNRRGRVFGIWALAAPIGMMLGLAGGGWMAQALGWRWSFVTVGVGGLVLVPALLLLKEPPRGQFEQETATERAAEAPPFYRSLLSLWRIRAFPLIICAVTLHLVGSTSLLNWSAPFYARIHRMPLDQVASVVALILGVGGALGAFASGYIVDALARRDRRWYAWAPGAAMVASAPLGIAQVLVPDVAPSIVLGVASAALGGFYLAPTCAAVQSMVPPQMRAFAASILLLIPAVIGAGGGPFVTGLLSDYLSAPDRLGEVAIKYAISVMLLGSALGGGVYISAGARLAHDLSQVQRRGAAPGNSPINADMSR
jgi:MFS family permease